MLWRQGLFACGVGCGLVTWRNYIGGYMSLHYHYEMIVNECARVLVDRVVPLDYNKRPQITKIAMEARDAILKELLPDVYGKTVDVPAVATGGDVAAPSVSEPATVDMVHQSGGVAAPVKKPSPRKKGAK